MKSAIRKINFPRLLAGAFAGAVAWYIGMMLFFGPAQAILANPEYQSEKFLKVFTQIEPYPHTASSPWVMYIGLLIISFCYSFVFALLIDKMHANRWKRGIFFGSISWLLMIPWFEFYLPWNVMHEPMALVLLEGVLWFLVLQLVGISISWCYPKADRNA